MYLPRIADQLLGEGSAPHGADPSSAPGLPGNGEGPPIACAVVSTQMQTCYRHGDRKAGVVCQRCDRPICPSCMHQASVGFHCPECTKQGAQKVVRAHQLRTRPTLTYALMAVNIVIFILSVGSGLEIRPKVVFDYAMLGSDPVTGNTL